MHHHSKQWTGTASCLQKQELHETDGTSSPPVSLPWLCHLLWPHFYQRSHSPQLKSVPLTFKRSPTGGNLLPGVGDLNSRLQPLGEGRMFNKLNSEPCSLIPKVKLLDGR